MAEQSVGRKSVSKDGNLSPKSFSKSQIESLKEIYQPKQGGGGSAASVFGLTEVSTTAPSTHKKGMPQSMRNGPITKSQKGLPSLMSNYNSTV